MIKWNPTPRRRSNADEIADVPGFGRFRIKPSTDRAGVVLYTVTQNGEPIGRRHDTAESAKAAVADLTRG